MTGEAMAKEISAEMVAKLREKTGAALMDCKKALTETAGDTEKAIDLLRKKGVDTAAKKAGRAAKEGRVLSYIHHNSKVGVLIEVNCETDFVARNPEFEQFVKDCALQVTALKPRWVSREQVPADIIAREKEIYAEQVKGKPAAAMEKILAGKLDKFYAENCLIEQATVKDPKVTVQELMKGLIAKLGENIVVRRFARFEIGEGE